jgi:hypothetical protein
MLPLRILPAALASATLDPIFLSYTSGETRNLDLPCCAAPFILQPGEENHSKESHRNCLWVATVLVNTGPHLPPFTFALLCAASNPEHSAAQSPSEDRRHIFGKRAVIRASLGRLPPDPAREEDFQ